MPMTARTLNLFPFHLWSDTMNSVKPLTLGLLMAALATGCDPKPSAGVTKPSAEEKTGDDGDEHAHGEGPNGGVIFDLGRYHAEFTVDHGKKECYVLFVKGEDKNAKPLPVACKELTLTTKPTTVKEGADKGKAVPPMTVTLKPADEKDGKAAKFVGTDPGIGNVADFEGDVTGEIGGKPSSGQFKE
jgi:hypothetical protein